MVVITAECCYPKTVMREGVKPMVKKIRQMFQSDEGGWRGVPEEVFEFCDKWLISDPQCFDLQTRGGNLTSIWSFLDTNKDAVISTSEFAQVVRTMDLDLNNQTTALEFEAFFSLNSHLVCRPYRGATFKRLTDRMRTLRNTVKSNMLSLFNILDLTTPR